MKFGNIMPFYIRKLVYYSSFHIKSITSDTTDSFTIPVGDGSVRKTHNQFGSAIQQYMSHVIWAILQVITFLLFAQLND